MTYRKIGGLHWLSIGRFRLAWCIKRRVTYKPLPKIHHFDWETPAFDNSTRPFQYSIETNANYRNAMIDSGRGRLLR